MISKSIKNALQHLSLIKKKITKTFCFSELTFPFNMKFDAKWDVKWETNNVISLHQDTWCSSNSSIKSSSHCRQLHFCNQYSIISSLVIKLNPQDLTTVLGLRPRVLIKGGWRHLQISQKENMHYRNTSLNKNKVSITTAFLSRTYLQWWTACQIKALDLREAAR